VSAVLLAGLTSLNLSLGAPGTARAGTITINDLSPPPSVSSSGFSTSSITTNSMNQTVTFNGAYESTGGFPAPGQSATYWVVFQNSLGTQTDATELMITGLSHPTPTENTSVHVFFEGLITTPISPGPGIYFIKEPAGYFDAAAYLVRRGAPDVPSDLSVRIATLGSVPEPSSLVTGVIGLLLGGLCVGRKRGRN
jgi:hypothetical protein